MEISKSADLNMTLESQGYVKGLVTNSNVSVNTTLLPSTKQFSDTSWVSHNFTQFWHCLAGDCIRSPRWRAQSHRFAPRTHTLQTAIASSGCHLCFWSTPILDWRFSQPPIPLVSIDLLEKITELKENILLTKSPVYYKRI